METIVQWATILSPIIAVIIAVLASRHSAKETAKHIDSIKESTKLQVDSIKELAKVQISVTKIQLYKELSDARHRSLLANKKEGDALEREHSLSIFGYVNEDIIYKEQGRQEKRANIAYEQEFYTQQAKRITDSLKKLEEAEKALQK